MNDVPRFYPGQREVVNGRLYIIEQGEKTSNDLRLVYANGDPIKMELTFFLIDFFTYNEDRRYEHEPSWRFGGGDYFMTMCAHAYRHGWQRAARAVADARNGRRKTNGYTDDDGLWGDI